MIEFKKGNKRWAVQPAPGDDLEGLPTKAAELLPIAEDRLAATDKDNVRAREAWTKVVRVCRNEPKATVTYE